MSVFVVSALQIHKANVSADSLLPSPMPLLTPQSFVGLSEKKKSPATDSGDVMKIEFTSVVSFCLHFP